MKRVIPILTVILFVMAGCEGNKQSTDDLIIVDVSKSYPKKELILQDFMDVEYIALETTDEFLTQGLVLDVGKEYLLVTNRNSDGDIFIFDRKTGKGLRKINRRGQGAEEYAFINGVVLDEDNNEIFVNCSPTKKIFVYDLSGNFKRSFAHTEGADYWNIFNYDNDNLIRYDNSAYYKDGEPRGNQSYHAIISKQDGSITQNISIPFDVIKAPIVREGEGTATASVRPIIPYHDTWLLVETSSDTVYNYVPQKNKLIPFLVKTLSTDPEVFLTMGTLTDRFYFMQTMKKMFDFTTGRGFPINDLMYDKQKNAIFNASVFNGDYLKKQEVNMTSHPVNGVIATFQNLAASQLVEAYENDELRGKLKEIAAELDEEANPVIMLVKHKE